jgi:MFS family permease
MQSTISLFAIRGYSSFFMGRIFNSTSVWVDFTLIFSLMSFHYNANPGVLGMTAALYGLPGLLLGPFIGALADRKSPALIMLCGACARFVTSLGLTFAPNEGVFVAWVFAKGISNLGTVSAEQIVIRRLLSDAQIVSTVALTSIVDQCTKVLSPLLGAALSFTLHSRGGFALTGVLALFSMWCAISVAGAVGWRDSYGSRQRRYPDFVSFWRVMAERPALASTLGLVLTFSIILGLYDSLVVVLLRDHGLPANSFGSIVSCTALGAVGCGIVIKYVLTRVSESKSMTWFLVGFSATVVLAGFLALAVTKLSLGVLCLLWCINGFCYGGGVMAYSVSLQKESPRDSLGIVSASARSLQLAALVIGPIIGSWVAQHVGLGITFISAGGIGLAIATYVAAKQALARERSKGASAQST